MTAFSAVACVLLCTCFLRGLIHLCARAQGGIFYSGTLCLKNIPSWHGLCFVSCWSSPQPRYCCVDCPLFAIWIPDTLQKNLKLENWRSTESENTGYTVSLVAEQRFQSSFHDVLLVVKTANPVFHYGMKKLQTLGIILISE